ncbi:unnamed protein product [Vitrella brassicaformis CCMP3155]|uniref:Jacalin-type lectin domain-containing protein n=1 Tax=Vitrella brassicaformis (strain CCMP3155) TaxID=1169540 RepID=A0A0G4ENC2_VITBC|nr:unnamed protein product [Vitrella brassicaformis CCMP3155]|eukprot:CEL98524.1 unnamed protein product [Vitrella brassicaformis CCMP3155]
MTLSYSDGRITVSFGGGGGSAFDDRATLISQYPNRKVDEFRLSSIRIEEWAHGIARVSSTYVSLVDGERVTLTHGSSSPDMQDTNQHNFDFEAGEWIRSVKVLAGPHKQLQITTNRNRAITCGPLQPDRRERFHSREVDPVVRECHAIFDGLRRLRPGATTRDLINDASERT